MNSYSFESNVSTTTSPSAPTVKPSNNTFEIKISWKNSINSTDIAMKYVLTSSSLKKKRETTSQGLFFAFGLSKDTLMVT